MPQTRLKFFQAFLPRFPKGMEKRGFKFRAWPGPGHVGNRVIRNKAVVPLFPEANEHWPRGLIVRRDDFRFFRITFPGRKKLPF